MHNKVYLMAKKRNAKKAIKTVPFHVITKPFCSKSEALKKWLNVNNVKFEEWSLADEVIKRRLTSDDKFTERFCDIEGCMLYTPMIRLDDSGVYYLTELFDQNGLRVDAVKKLLKIK